MLDQEIDDDPRPNPVAMAGMAIDPLNGQLRNGTSDSSLAELIELVVALSEEALLWIINEEERVTNGPNRAARAAGPWI